MAPHTPSPRDSESGQPLPDYSPEARARDVHKPAEFADLHTRIGPGTRAWVVLKRVVVSTFNDGTIHAGNLAYMSVLAIFPFFITAAAIFSVAGDYADRVATIDALLTAMPPVVADVIGPAARSVIDARSGWLLWIGGAIGLWTVGSLIETIRDILRRAYGTRATRAFWQYRLATTAIIIGAVLLLMTSLIAQVMIGTAQEVIEAAMPQFYTVVNTLEWSRIIPTIVLYGSILLLFVALTPPKYRGKRYPKWPGALLVTVWWFAVTVVLPPLLRGLFTYDLTYGPLAGFMIALFFFWLVGLGVVAGAELNAALAETPEEERRRLGDPGHRAQADRTEEVSQ
ncbi:YihY/virulence factor BrkB family protein [Erythrobacter sp. EC-HK427]|uniref:YihY/virulence factor BrkB family protein n=1 Tax=Erythrobacter sp. EC-HK427 TaxID=2038396 RepID=UPI0012522C14|nr:YihY/virulence factor BrkB family protein [Erythrobacter sp. EC-HK427]VVT03947.1 Ribonuclease BN [Erythrobacter sp. EC-HK427]